MTQTQRFIWGFGGSLAVEVVVLYQAYHLEKILIPERYRRVGFWIVRTCLSAMAGGLAIAYEIDKPLLAANIGASAPLILQALARGLVGDLARSKPRSERQPRTPA